MDLQRLWQSFAATAHLLRSRTRGIVGVIAIPFETGNHHSDYGNAKFRTREIHRYNSLNPDRAQSLKLPSEVNRDIIRIVAGNVTK
jgi:hypothetical protein